MIALLRELRALLEGAEEIHPDGPNGLARLALPEDSSFGDRAQLLVRLDAAIRELEQRRES